MPSRSTARALVWGALAGQLAFIAAWVVAGALEPGYSHVDQGVSELGAATASHPLIFNAGLVVLGASLAALGVALAPALPRRRAAWVAAGLFVATGVAMALAGVFHLDCGPAVDAHCRALWRAGELSWQQDAHVWSGFVGDLLLMATPFALAAALWPAPSGVAALGAGVSGLLISGLSALGSAGGDDGLVQRLSLGVLHLWVVIVAIGILHVLRRPPRFSELIPLRPRDFLARSWRGSGELIPWPYVLGRRLARPFEARREATWMSERVWRFDDEVRFADGRALRRRTFCEFVDGDRVRLTAGDLPDGADVRLEEGGYRMEHFRMAFPIGPVPLYMRVREQSYVEPDGTFANVFEARWLVLGLPLARLVFHVRPELTVEDAAPAPSEATA